MRVKLLTSVATVPGNDRFATFWVSRVATLPGNDRFMCLLLLLATPRDKISFKNVFLVEKSIYAQQVDSWA
jgi:hypothetical protein